MSERRLKLLMAALAIGILVYVGLRVATDGGEPPSEPLTLESAGVETLDSVIVESAEDTVRLRGGEGWAVNGREAVADAGETLQNALQDARVGQLVSRNPENHDRLGVAEGQGHLARFYVGDTARLSLILGDAAGGFGDAYVRRAGDDEVHVLEGTLVNLLRRGVEDWRNKEILATAREDVQAIEFAYPEETFRAVRDSAAWRLEPGGVEVRSDAIAPLLSQLVNLRALGFAADSVADGLDWTAATARVRVVGPGGSDLAELSFLAREENGYFARRSDKPVVYTVSQFTGDQILKKRDELIADGADASDASESEGAEEGASEAGAGASERNEGG